MIRSRAANPVEAHKEKFSAKRNVFEEAMKQEQANPAASSSLDNFNSMFDESFRVEETKTMETQYVESGDRRRPVIQSSTPKHQNSMIDNNE